MASETLNLSWRLAGGWQRNSQTLANWYFPTLGTCSFTATKRQYWRNCWPDTYLAEHFAGSAPWRFVNGGLWAGTPESILLWCDEIETHPAYSPKMIDQQWFNHRRLQGDPVTQLDTDASLFYCMIHDQSELAFDKGIPVNTLTGHRPNFIHFNGKTDPTMFFLRQAVSKGFK
jgi:hypothetical protein